MPGLNQLVCLPTEPQNKAKEGEGREKLTRQINAQKNESFMMCVDYRFSISVPLFIIRAVVRSDAFYRMTVRRFRVLRMWDIVSTSSLSKHHFLQCPVWLVKWDEPLVHQNTTKRHQDGHCPESIVVNLRFGRGVQRGSVLRHLSFSAHVRRARTCDTWVGSGGCQ